MCGIIVSDLDISKNFNIINKRGPDNTNITNINNINFAHFLLHLTGEKTYQPITENNVTCIFNGEIYNYKEINPDSKSDIHSILHTYNLYDESFIKYLDGEFTIVLFDFNKNKLFIASDIFKTKPLFYQINEHIVISTYESVCKDIKNQSYNSINPNEVLVFDLNTHNIIKKYKVYDFNLQQTKTHYNDFCDSLEKAILKRYPEKTIPLISLSSGHDSGIIACCLQKYNKPFLAICINKNENNEILMQRKQILNDKLIFIDLNQNDKNYWKKYLIDSCEPFIWDWTYHPKMRNYKPNGFDMGSMLGKCKILNHTQNINSSINIMYSGIGADEVMAFNSFYSRGYGNVDIFDHNLETIFPWKNFFNGSMENYLKGDEYVGGSFSFETRYPYCDKNLIQEFLWLSPELKNNFNGIQYKPALTYYLQKEKFPFHIKKYGFNV